MIGEHRNGQRVANHAANRLHDFANLLHEFGAALELGGVFLIRASGPIGRNVNLHECGGTGIDGAVIHVNDVLTLLQIRLGSRIFHVANGLFLGDDIRKSEERRLQNGVRAFAHANLYGQVNSVDGIEVDVVLRNVALRGGTQVLSELLGRPLAVHHEGTMGLHVVHDREVFLNVARVVARHEVGLVDVVRTANGLVAETQVRNGHAAGFLGVVLEVRLHVFFGMVADDFDGVLVRANRAVAAQAPELALDGAGRRGVRRIRVFRKREVGHVVDDAHSKLATGGFLGKLGENGEHRRGRRIFTAQAITAASNQNARAAFAVQGVDHVEGQRLARRAPSCGRARRSSSRFRAGIRRISP